MKTERSFPRAAVTEKAARSLKAGHPWVFADEITSIDGQYENGGLIDVLYKNRYMGTGFINNYSKIRIRIISKNANDKFSQLFSKELISPLDCTANKNRMNYCALSNAI
ncbi:ribosomal RNA large subunit methyltransferase I [Clostridiales bacterium]|nr:ribosomal RNA large subunit methyltransferase I [Clostridiales bacterium]